MQNVMKRSGFMTNPNELSTFITYSEFLDLLYGQLSPLKISINVVIEF